MDNERQIDEIKKYRDYLSHQMGFQIDENSAAILWIKKYAKIWRLTHPKTTTCVLS